MAKNNREAGGVMPPLPTSDVGSTMPPVPSMAEQDPIPLDNPAPVQAPVRPVNHQIEVKVDRPGFLYGMRRGEGDKFMVKRLEDLGDWMTCVDPVWEKKRRAFLYGKPAGN